MGNKLLMEMRVLKVYCLIILKLTSLLFWMYLHHKRRTYQGFSKRHLSFKA